MPDKPVEASDLHTDPGLTPALNTPLSSGGTSNILLNKPYTGNLPVAPNFNNPPTPQQAVESSIEKPKDLFKFQKDFAEGAPTILTNSEDKFAYNKAYTYNPESENQSQNFNRFYQHWDFNKLGYKPWADNEAVYREKGGAIFGDVTRAVWAGMKLAGTGFVSPLRSFADLATGNALSLDYTSEKEMRQLNQEGSSTRGGVSGFTANMFTNAGYTVGIMGEMVAEDLLLGLAAPETGGASAGLAVARTTRAVEKLGAYYTAVQGLNKAVDSIKSFSKASEVYKALKGTAKFLNPLENTVDAVRAISSSKNITNLAKVSQTAGAFYRDLRMANLTLSESKLEGASTAHDFRKDAIDKYYADHGQLPEGDKLDEINRLAEEAGDHTLYWNIPTIFLTNKITFPKFLNSFGKVEQIATKYGSKVSLVKGVGYEVVKDDFKTALKALRSPKAYGKVAANYFKGNFSEGFQESAQEIISGGAKDYYTRLLDNPAKQGTEYGLTDVMSNAGKQFSGQGFETFASGFFMGGLIGAGGKIYKGAKEQVLKFRDPERYAAYQTIKNADATARAASLTEVYKNPLKYFGSGILNLSNQTLAAQGQDVAAKVGDEKAWMDWHDQSVAAHITTALETGTYGNFMEQLHEISKMDSKAIEDAYGINGEDALKNIQKVQDRAEKLKEDYDYYTKKHPSPYNPNSFEKDTPEWRTEVLGDIAWKHAVHDAIWFNHSFERNRQRVESIAKDLMSQGTLSTKSSHEITPLYDMQALTQKKETLIDDIRVTRELPDAQSKKDTEFKRKQLKLLRNYEKALKGHFLGQLVQETEGKDTNGELKNAYTQYLRHVSGRDKGFFLSKGKLNTSFEQVKDIHKLGIENVNLSPSINTLVDQEGFYKYHEAINKTMTELYENREEQIKKSVEAVQAKLEDNALIKTLFARGFVVDVEDLDKLTKEGEIPKEFYDVASKQVVKSGDIRYDQFKQIVQDYLGATGKEEKVEVPPAQEAQTSAVKQVIQTATGKIRIFRHGETVEDQKGINSGPTQEHITPEGAKHVEEGAQDNTEGLTKIVVSSRQRAKDSAEVVAKGKDVVIEENAALDPWNTGDEKTGFAGIPDEDWHKIDAWFAVNPTEKVYAGDAVNEEGKSLKEIYADRQSVESFNEFKDRVLNALPAIVNSLSDGGGIMTHSNVIQLLKAYKENGSKNDGNLGMLFVKNEPSKNGEVIDFQRQEVDPTFAEVKQKEEVQQAKAVDKFDLQGKLDAVNTEDELQELREEIEKALQEGTLPAIDGWYKYATDAVEAKNIELFSKVDISTLRKGDVVTLKNSKYQDVQIKRINSKNGKIQIEGFYINGLPIQGDNRYITMEDIKYTAHMKQAKTTVTSAEKELVKTNQKQNVEFGTNDAELKKIEDATEKKTTAEVTEEWLKNTGCK